VAVLSYDYSSAEVWLDDLAGPDIGSGHPLCAHHAGRFTPPVGWSALDRRATEFTAPRAVA
jgi:hypothetical protein